VREVLCFGQLVLTLFYWSLVWDFHALSETPHFNVTILHLESPRFGGACVRPYYVLYERAFNSLLIA